jgi:NAD(P)-dependent dehydrogenase (short-subunit alcohol dehydrogenase family)
MNRTTLALAATGLAAFAVDRYQRGQRAIDLAGRHVLISGGSRGLGLELARAFAAQGARLTLLARTDADLQTAREELVPRFGVDVRTIAVDLRDRLATERAVAEAFAHHGRLDVLVHNAGIIAVGPEEHQDEATYREAMDVHFWAARYLTEAALPHLRRDGSARIVYNASIAGRVAVPHLAAYSASKHALVGYADAMRAELAPKGIRVTTVTPGLMRTGSHPNAFTVGDHEAEYALFATADANPLVSTSSSNAAERIVDACRHGDAALTLTLAAKALALIDGAAPGVIGRVMRGVSGLLPAPVGPEGDVRQTGWQSTSDAAPSLLTRLADDDIACNNELKGHADPVR